MINITKKAIIVFALLAALFFTACNNGWVQGILDPGPTAPTRAPGALVQTPPVLIPGTRTPTSFIVDAAVLYPTTPTGLPTVQNIQYAISTNPDPTEEYLETLWEPGTNAPSITFSDLQPDTTYYVFARSVQNDNFEAGPWERSAPITTLRLGGIQINVEDFFNQIYEDVQLPWRDEDGNIINDIEITHTTGEPITLELTGEFDSIVWRVDSMANIPDGDAVSFTLRPQDFRHTNVGLHSLFVEVIRDGVPHSRTVLFSIIELEEV